MSARTTGMRCRCVVDFVPPEVVDVAVETRTEEGVLFGGRTRCAPLHARSGGRHRDDLFFEILKGERK